MTFNGTVNAFTQAHLSLVCLLRYERGNRQVIEMLPAHLSVVFLLIQPDIRLVRHMQPIPLLGHISNLLLHQ